ncbi:hypothetical protein J437_LFUL005714 [Ladona fulva]|uniref:Uncharacterized protein n=1 Tax=Ladona fulva TaxID=123851 RepID=A0A8K0NV54_LADFU|nr:hypothetical protein J437_LFUL005714 [Ladona fulva]
MTTRSKLAWENLKEKVKANIKECDGLREDLKDSNLSYNVNHSKASISKNLSLKNMRDNFKMNMNEESQCWYVNRSKSLDRDNYSMYKALGTCKVENELPYRAYHSMDHPSFTYNQEIENNHNMRMNQDLSALESPVYITDNKEHIKSPEKEPHVKIDMDAKASYKSMSLVKMESYPKILEKCNSLALHSLNRKFMVSKPGASYHKSADSLSAKHTPLKKGDRANSMSLNWDEQPFQKHPYSPFTCLKYQTEVFPTCDCGFPPKLCNCSSNSSRVGTVSENEAPLIVMEDEMEICPFLLQETSSGLYLNPSSTSRIVEEGREDDFTVMEIGPDSCENKCCSTSDDKTCTKIEID